MVDRYASKRAEILRRFWRRVLVQMERKTR